jgi:hypothetical protein
LVEVIAHLPARSALTVILSRSRGEPRHDTPGENRAATSAQRTFNECGGFLLRSEVSNANEVEAISDSFAKAKPVPVLGVGVPGRRFLIAAYEQKKKDRLDPAVIERAVRVLAENDRYEAQHGYRKT